MNTTSSYIVIALISLLFYGCHRNTAPVKVSKKGQNNFKVVGYLHSGNFDKIDLIELSRLTHLDIAFGNPDKAGHLTFSDPKALDTVVDKAHQAGLEVYLSIAGGGIDDEMAANWLHVLQPENRSLFIAEILEFVSRHHLDGIDVDIEWNLIPTITDLYTPFVVDLKNALHAKNKGISSALNVSGLHPSVTQEALEAYDFINVMVYDKTGIWRPEKIGPHAPYNYAEEALEYWTKKRRIPKEKLTLGVPFYGHDFEAVKYISFARIIEKDPENAYRDEIEKIFYNGIPTIVRKTKLARTSFGGIMIWELGNDTFNALSLLRAIDQTIKSDDCQIESVKTCYKDQDGDGYGDLKSPIQTCDCPKNYVENRLDADDSNQQVH